jgi:endonuclease/exonuclease/phosphatase family metal-dependent hydrolase
MPSPKTELRVLTYNVRSLRDDEAEVAAIIRSCAPDVVCIQEAPRFLRWRSKRAKLARESGLVVASAGRPGGLAVLTSLRASVLGTSFALLPLNNGKHRRAVVSTELEVGGVRCRVASVHLSTDADERQQHLEPLWSALRPTGEPPLVVAGDLNEDPGGRVYSAFSERLQDCHAIAGSGQGATSPADAPQRRIDAIFAAGSITVKACDVIAPGSASRASDHLPVLAVLEL